MISRARFEEIKKLDVGVLDLYQTPGSYILVISHIVLFNFSARRRKAAHFYFKFSIKSDEGVDFVADEKQKFYFDLDLSF